MGFQSISFRQTMIPFQHSRLRHFSAVAIVLGLAMLSSAALAEKPDWAGNGKGKKHQQEQQVATDVQIGAYFGERQRAAVSDYYETQSRAGKCPPGLAKKHNGCQPPGQAKKWKLGQRLDRDVVVYPIPQDVVVRIGVPPVGYRYVRVLNDVLMVAIGTNMVVDAIEDLMR
jgi:Ni/Co efflux regulator RcnB